MWKHKLTRDFAINFIKEKRKCVDINLGFLYQLAKWEELLKNDKKETIYKLDKTGNLSLIDINDKNKINIKENPLVLLLFYGNKFYKILNSICLKNEKTLNEKLNAFINLIQTYQNYPKEIEIIEFDFYEYENIDLISKKSLLIETDDLEELFKSRFYLHN